MKGNNGYSINKKKTKKNAINLVLFLNFRYVHACASCFDLAISHVLNPVKGVDWKTDT